MKIIRNMPCCKKQCLKSLPQDEGLALVNGCIDELSGMAQAEKKIYLLEKVRGCMKFAFIWKRVRNSFVLTPSAYKHAIEVCLSSSRIKDRERSLTR